MNLKGAIAFFYMVFCTAALAGPEEDRAAFVSALEQNGCVMSLENMQTVLDAAGLDMMRASGIINDLAQDANGVEMDDGLLLLKTDNCTQRSLEDFDNPRMMVFVSVLKELGCRVTSDTARKMMPDLGFEAPEARVLARQMMIAGHAHVEADSGALVLSTENCS